MSAWIEAKAFLLQTMLPASSSVLAILGLRRRPQGATQGTAA